MRQSVLHTLDKEFEDSETLWASKLSCVGAWIVLILYKRLNNIRLKHNKLKLELIGDVGLPFSFCFLFDCDEVFDFVLDKIVFRILTECWRCPLFLVTNVSSTQNTRFLHDPVK
jgi:hypothetical protein